MSTSPPSGPESTPHAAPHAEPAGPSTGVLEQTELREQAQPGDHERFAHYVRKERITSSAVNGTPVIALCGKVWVPTRDPSRFPVCPVCREIVASMNSGKDTGGK